MRDNHRIGKAISLLSYLMQGIIATLSAIVFQKLSAQWVVTLTLGWVLTFLILCVINSKTQTGKRIYCLINFLFSTVLAIGICILFRTEHVFFMMIFVQWLVCITFLDKKVNVSLLALHIAIVICFRFVKIPDMRDQYDSTEMLGGIVVLLLAFWISSTLIDMIEYRQKYMKEHEESLVDLLDVIEMKCEEAETASREKSSFLANMSHEIRTPINAVLGLDTMILRDSNQEGVVKYARDIQSAGRSLLSLINDILDFSKIESGKMELVYSDYDFASMVNDIVNMIKPKAEDKGLEFLIDVNEKLPCGFQGDDNRIKQILVNLLTNAVKYTKEGSVSLVVDHRCEDEYAFITFSVMDTGIGIRPEDIGKLTEKFVRIEESRNRNIEGTGLGINIVVSLLQLMDSKLEVESVYGQGSNFHFCIKQRIINNEPIGVFAERILEYGSDEKYQVSFCIPDSRLLVVDDNVMNRNVFINLLRDMECQIDEAESGVQCLELVMQRKYDVIFLDHMMPEMDGIETFERMRNIVADDYPNKNTPVVILTANAIGGAREEYLAKGFDEYLSKPIDADDLEEMIGEMIPDSKKKPAKKRDAKELEKKKIQTPEYDLADMPNIDGVDWRNAVQRLMSEELLMAAIEGFSEMADEDMLSLEGMLGALQTTDTDENYNVFRITAHSMKSNAATIGANHVAGLAKLLEYAARDKNIETIERLMPVFKVEWYKLRDAINEGFGYGVADETVPEQESNVATDCVVDKQPYIETVRLGEYLNIMKSAAEERDIDILNAVLEALSEYSYPDELKNLISDLRTSGRNMDIDSCKEIIDVILQML